MDRKTIEDFEKEHGFAFPESYIKFLLLCDNHPEIYCKGYPDRNLCPLEDFLEMQELYEMGEFCPEYIVIGTGGGGEVLIMKQEKDTNTLIVTEGGILETEYIIPENCRFFYDFFEEWIMHRCPAEEIDPMYSEEMILYK